MSIKIKTEKIVTSNGILSRKIVNFKGLGYKALPELYINSTKKATVDINRNGFTLRNVQGKYYREYTQGDIIPEEEFQEIIEHCKEAGQHLKACNAELKDKRASWNGPETFII